MVLVSGLSHAVYFGSLGKAYEAGDSPNLSWRWEAACFWSLPSPFLTERISAMGGRDHPGSVGNFRPPHEVGFLEESRAAIAREKSMWTLLSRGQSPPFPLVDKVAVGIVEPLLYNVPCFLHDRGVLHVPGIDE